MKVKFSAVNCSGDFNTLPFKKEQETLKNLVQT